MAKKGLFREVLFGGYCKQEVDEYIKTLEDEIETIKILYRKERDRLVRRLERSGAAADLYEAEFPGKKDREPEEEVVVSAAAQGEEKAVCGDLAAVQGEEKSVRGDLAAAQGEEKAVRGDLAAAQREEKAVCGDLAAAQGEEKAVCGDLAAAQGEEKAVRGDLAAAQREGGSVHGDLAAALQDEECAVYRVQQMQRAEAAAGLESREVPGKNDGESVDGRKSCEDSGKRDRQEIREELACLYDRLGKLLQEMSEK